MTNERPSCPKCGEEILIYRERENVPPYRTHARVWCECGWVGDWRDEMTYGLLATTEP